jgi:hypothetical protein
MTTTDWIIDVALIFIVLRQLREERLSVRFVILPAGIVYFVAKSYLHGLPTAGNDLVLIGALTAIGATLGLAGGLLTRVRAEAGSAFVRAGRSAAGLWVASMTVRLGFIVWISNASAGEHAITRFSAEHHITGANAWQTALVLLALSEVVVRLATIVTRGYLASTRSRSVGTAGDASHDAPAMITI